MSSRSLAKLLGSASVLSVATMTSGLAQEATAAAGETIELQTVVISGEKVERSLDDTASSVAVLSAEEIDKKVGNASVADAIEDIPNVVYGTTVGQAPVIRGQDTQGPNTGTFAFLGGTVPRATINVDGHYLGYDAFVFGSSSLWDVESIEVFRGPQTTSQGANAIAGAIIVKTKDPTFIPEATLQVQYGSDARLRTSLAASGPLTDQLAARIALDYHRRDTYVDYTNPAFTVGDTEQDLEDINGRVKLLWQPDALPGFEAKLTYSNTQNKSPTYEAVFEPYDDLESPVTAWPSWKVHSQTGILDLSYDLANGIKIYDQAQYSYVESRRTTEPSYEASAASDVHNVSNETRVTFGDAEDTLSGVAGAYYAHTTSDETLDQYAYLYGMTAFDDTKDNLGLFSELSYRLTDRWTLTGGLRYQHDRIRREGTYAIYSADIDYDETFDAVLPKVSLSYDLTPDVTVGGMVSRGYNPGGVSLDLYGREWVPFDEETLWDYELFARAHLLDDKLYLTGNLFYMDMENTQLLVQQTVDGYSQYRTINADEAYSYGLEMSANYRLFENFGLTGGLGLLKTKITDFAAAAESYEGNELARSPGFMFSLGFDWDIVPDLNLSAEVRYTDDYYSDSANTKAYLVGSYAVANARMSYQVNDNAQIFGYVNNIFDDHSPTYLQASRTRATSGMTEAAVLSPREFGAGIKLTF
ncbi:TonB-dependent receptor [Consotaella aegiceratis]|uniref:TonB-dependent receptor n=1 Tax=Consotaella aegiceratis TaxID=3097961 RepID=UPI002F42661E